MTKVARLNTMVLTRRFDRGVIYDSLFDARNTVYDTLYSSPGSFSMYFTPGYSRYNIKVLCQAAIRLGQRFDDYWGVERSCLYLRASSGGGGIEAHEVRRLATLRYTTSYDTIVWSMQPRVIGVLSILECTEGAVDESPLQCMCHGIGRVTRSDIILQGDSVST